MNCVYCGETLDIDDKVDRHDKCPHCSHDLHCCKQCKFYDQSAYNECREVNADRIFDKERANHCDFFIMKGSKGKSGGRKRTKDAKDALEALFKKK